LVKPLRSRLEEARKRLGIPWEVLERDYVLSWVLVGIARVGPLAEGLVFKGGTALRKCYFPEYRFSEDLDFSTAGAVPTGEAMAAAVAAACAEAARLLNHYAPAEIACERYTERDPHPGGQEAFVIRIRLPWHRTARTRVMVEITMDEDILGQVRERPVIHGYGEAFDACVKVYGLEEIVAEKLRAILQQAKRLQERGWSRSRARDYYDLWRIACGEAPRLELEDFPTFLARKCEVRGVTFGGPDDFFQEAMLGHVGRTWEEWLGPLVPELPPFERIIGDLRPRIMDLLRT
jgi:predicted nucleotidyltransferase component of viral defense system